METEPSFFKAAFIGSWMLFLICIFEVHIPIEYRTVLDWLIITSILLGVSMSIGLIFRFKLVYEKYIKYLLSILFLAYCLAWTKDLVGATYIDKHKNFMELLIWVVTIKAKLINYSLSQGRYFFALSKFYREMMLIIQIGLFVWWRNIQTPVALKS